MNDTQGHQVGDKVLVEIARLLAAGSRVTDTVGRWGGEEFLIICPEANDDSIRIFAEHMRSKIENHRIPNVGQITASFGLTIYRDADSLDSLMRRADQALYCAKEHGRNQVSIA